MTTAKLSGDKLQLRAFTRLFQGYIDLEKQIIDLVEESTADDKFRAKIYRQLNSISAIIRKEYYGQKIIKRA